MINIENCQEDIYLSPDFIDRISDVVEMVLEHEQVNVEYEVNILFVNNSYIKDINFNHRGIDKETDCLSFPMINYQEGKFYKDQYLNYEFKDYELDEGKVILGDILISTEKAKSQSLEFGHGFDREIIYLIIHSLLHLLGYDHMKSEDKKIMRFREKQIIKLIGVFK